MDIVIENFLKQNIFPDLEKGRVNFDKPHTEAVVYYVKKLIEKNPKLNLDSDILIITAYAHDWGYTNLYPLTTYEDINLAKKVHMSEGSKLISNLLNNNIFNYLTKKQKNKIVYLVGIHDEINLLKNTIDLIFMEADSLATLDINKVKPSFNKESDAKYMKSVRINRLSHFITNYGKQTFEKLYELRQKYYKKMKTNSIEAGTL